MATLPSSTPKNVEVPFASCCILLIAEVSLATRRRPLATRGNLVGSVGSVCAPRHSLTEASAVDRRCIADADTVSINRERAMMYSATKQQVSNRGIAPDGFLDELVAWGRDADSSLFVDYSNDD